MLRDNDRSGSVGLASSAELRPPRASRVAPAPDLQPIGEPDSLREYLGVLARHKVLITLSALLTTLAALVYSAVQSPLYEASSSVLVTQGGAGSALSEIPGFASTSDPERQAATHLTLARLPLVAQRTIDAADLRESSGVFLGRSAVVTEPDADILHFSVRDGTSDEAQRLATIYAQQFTRYRNELDLKALQATRAAVSRTLAKLSQQGQQGSLLYRELTQDLRRLDAAKAVRGSAAIVVQPAAGTSQVQPQPKRNAALGLVLGLLYGVGIAFLVERFDTRVRTAEQIESLVDLRILGELPPPPQTSPQGRDVSMLHRPHGPYAESVRKLRANLEFAGLGVDLRTLMVTSAVAGEGKTTVAADLAAAFARSGRSVALCDLDARAPTLDRALGLDTQRGLVDVATGRDSLDSVLVEISWAGIPGRVPSIYTAHAVADASSEAQAAARGDAGGKSGLLHVLTLGSRRPHDPADFVGSSSVRQVVESLAETHDVVIVDTAPLLPVSDAWLISEYVDAALIVSGLATVRKPQLRTIRRMAVTFPTRIVGVVVTGTARVAGAAYGSDVAEADNGRD